MSESNNSYFKSKYFQNINIKKKLKISKKQVNNNLNYVTNYQLH